MDKDIKKSILSTFINHKEGFTLHVLDGTSALVDLQKIHSFEEATYHFFKDITLGALQLTNYLKGDENLGFYIDSEEPYFRYKIEMSNNGQFRTLFLPEEIPHIPDSLNGKCRVTKIFGNREPYTSIIEMSDTPTGKLVNHIFEQSYQANVKALVHKESPVSVLIAKLPPTNVDKKVEDFEDLSIDAFESKYEQFLESLFNADVMADNELNEVMQENGFKHLASKEILCHCPCSKERFIKNLFTLSQENRDELFNEAGVIEVRCDYCNSVYEMARADFSN